MFILYVFAIYCHCSCLNVPEKTSEVFNLCLLIIINCSHNDLRIHNLSSDCKKSLKIPKGQSDSVKRRTDNTMAKRKIQKDKQRSTKHTYKTKDWVTWTPLKTGGELRCSGMVSSSCSTGDTRRVNLTIVTRRVPQVEPALLTLSFFSVLFCRPLSSCYSTFDHYIVFYPSSNYGF